MTDFDKLAEILKMSEKDKEEIFEGLIYHNIELVLDFHEDGSISWGTIE